MVIYVECAVYYEIRTYDNDTSQNENVCACHKYGERKKPHGFQWFP